MVTVQSVNKMAVVGAWCTAPVLQRSLRLKDPPDSDMFQAAASGDDEWLLSSLKRAESPTELNKQGLTVLHVAAHYGHLNCLKLLVESGAVDVNTSCPRGRRPVHMALGAESKPDSYHCLTYLLEHGAQANVSTDEGVTPLHVAAAEGLTECVGLLVGLGADTHSRDIRGHTALDLARLWGHRDIARFLKNAMWHRDKKTDTERRQALQDLKQDLIWKHRKAEGREKLSKEAVNRQKVSEWAENKGFPMPQSPQMDSRPTNHAHCRFSKPAKSKNTTKRKQNTRWNVSPNPSTPPPAIISRSQGVRMGVHADKASDDPDLRQSVTLGRFDDGRLNCTASWDGVTQPVPDLALDVIRKGLFPFELRPRIDHPREFYSRSVLDLPRRGGTTGPGASPWTEVAMHLAEELQPGHY